MARQDANDAFAHVVPLWRQRRLYRTALRPLRGRSGNRSTPSGGEFFEALKDDASDVEERARRVLASARLAAAANGELISALDGNWARSRRRRRQGQGKAQATRAAPSSAEPSAAGDARFGARADDDPRLPHARPSARQSRSARARKPEEDTRSSIRLLRLHRGRLRPQDLHRQRARAGVRDHPRDARDPARTYCSTLGVEFMHISDPGSRRPGSRSASRARTRRSPSPARASARSSTS
jgi:2-oxoglutarate dehydrogenase E1 component